MITEKKIGYYMMGAIMSAVLLFFVHVLVIRLGLILLFVFFNAPIFIYFSRKGRELQTSEKIQYNVFVVFGFIGVAIIEAVFAAIPWGIVQLIKML